MPATDIAAALRRAQSVLQRRPGAALQQDAPAAARWAGGTRVATQHPGGLRVVTDMPVELGGSGDQVSPGWLVRAGFASCTATLVAMVAAERGIALESVEVVTGSESDARGLLGVADADGGRVPSGPRDLRTSVRVAARHATVDEVRAVVDEACRRSPVACALENALAPALSVDVVIVEGA